MPLLEETDLEDMSSIPEYYKGKSIFVTGGSGLAEEDRSLLINEINIIFHSAASVRFDDTLKLAARMNLRGTKEMVELAKCMHKLEAFVHISTSYANTNRNPIEEVIYPPLADWRDTLHICDTVDDKILKPLTAKYLGEMPNTYAFTKQLAGHVIYEHRGKLPIVIIRPSIVFSSVDEPIPGWIENFNGPVGVMAARGTGISRIDYAKPNLALDYIPVDIVIKSTIVASWFRGIKKLEPTDDIQIYNSCSGNLNKITIEDTIVVGRQYVEEKPLSNTIWLYSDRLTYSLIYYNVQVWLYHVLPAIFIDMLLWIMGKERMLLKLQRRIYMAHLAVNYYMTREWNFGNTNFLELRAKIKEEDKEAFFYNFEDVDIFDYIKKSFNVVVKYILNDTDDKVPLSRTRVKRIKFLDNAIKSLFYGLIFWWLMNVCATYFHSDQTVNIIVEN